MFTDHGGETHSDKEVGHKGTSLENRVKWGEP